MQKLTFIKELDKLEETIKQQIPAVFSEGEKIAVKVHMGETHNKFYLKPDIIKKIISALKELNLNPFLFDSPVVYPGGRDTVEKYYKTAEEHGFTEESIGCPIIISDESVDVKTKNLAVHVCKPITEADGMLVITHVKGHSCSAIGASIKNIGMGCVSRQSKADIHGGAMPEYTAECQGCGVCKESCPAHCIEMKDKKAVFDLDSCWGCSSCILNCPHGVLKPNLSHFDNLLAQGAQAVLKKTEKVFFINIMVNLARKCDCADNAGPIIAEDIGILLGKDIVAIDKASVDLINKQKPNAFKEIHHHDPYLHIKYAKKLGMGEEEYDIS